jgi:site-specific recombinase XerD
MAGLMYGGGLRLMECVRLRLKDVDFERNQITVRDGKGKDRVTVLPGRFAAPMKEHLGPLKAIYESTLNHSKLKGCISVQVVRCRLNLPTS